MIFYHNNTLYKQDKGSHKFNNGLWDSVRCNFELYEVKQRFLEIRKIISEVK